MSGEQYCAEVPEYVRVGGVSGASKSLTIGGGTNPILGRPSAIVLVRVKEERNPTNPATSRYVPVNSCGENAEKDMNSAAWLVTLDRYAKDGFQATIQDSDLRGKFPGVLIILVYPQTDMGRPTTPLSGVGMLLMRNPRVSTRSYNDLRPEAREKIEKLFAYPVAKIERGFLKPPP